LPFLRFSRDKRGYEITCLMHTFRRRGKARPRILYCFRTPPGVKVGRAALDEGAIRAIEEHNQDLKFDWEQILQTQLLTGSEGASADSPPGRRRPGAARGSGGDARRTRAGASQPPGKAGREPADRQPRPGSPGQSFGRPPGDAARPVEPSPPAAPETTAPDHEARVPVPVTLDRQAGSDRQAAAALSLPFDEGEGGEAEGQTGLEPEGPDRLEADPGEPVRPLSRVLSTENAARLRARFAEILARISERVQDPVKLEDLRARAERLNPDSWVTADEVREGLEHYEIVYHSLRAVLGRRRRRHRRGGAGQVPGAAPGGTPGGEPETGSDPPGDDPAES
jgi:hypothetical protein